MSGALAGKRKEFELENGNKFYIRRYDPFLALEILGEVQKKFLPAIAGIVEANDTTLDQTERLESVMKAIDSISKNLDGKSLTTLVRTVLNKEYVSVSIQADPPIQLDEGAINRACDDVFDVIQLVTQVLRYNYERLFMQGRTLIGLDQEQPTIQ